MQEHPVLQIVKVALLGLVALLLLVVFIAHNETQAKVIATHTTVDELKDQVGEIKRAIASGVRVEGGGSSTTTPAAAGPRIPGNLVLLEAEPERPRPPDEEIDFDAQLNHQIPVEPKGLNIFTSDRDNYTASWIGTLVYPPLGERRRDDKNLFKPGLAEHAEVSPDHTEFHIWLRKGVRWHRPALDLTDPKHAWMKGDHEVTTDDVVFTLDMIMDERADTSAVRASFADMKEYKAIDRHHLMIRWKEPSFYAMGLILSDIQPVPKWIYAHDEDGTPIEQASLGQQFAKHWFSKSMCGCGSYRFVEYKQSDYILLERNEDYWGRRPALKRIFWKLALKDDEPRYNTFMRMDEKGLRDQFSYPISPVRWKREVIDGDGSSELLDNRKVYIYQYQRMMYAYQGWNCKSRFFQDARVRRAMSHAANRESWRYDILYDIAIFPTGIAYTESPEYDPSVKPWEYDLEKAKALLDEAGWKDEDGNGIREKTIQGEKVEFRFKCTQTPGSPEIDAMRSDHEQSMRKIGVVMEPQVVEWNEFLKRVQDREFESMTGAWFHGDDFQPDTLFHSRLLKEPRSHNYVQWENQRADEIMDALKTTFDLKKRYELCHELHRVFHEDQPYTIMWSWKNPVAVDARIGNLYARNVSPQIDLRDVYWMKKGVAKYDDGRDKGKGWMRKSR